MGTDVTHPDVKRMLLSMRALTNAARAICYTTAVAIDRARYRDVRVAQIYEGTNDIQAKGQAQKQGGLGDRHSLQADREPRLVLVAVCGVERPWWGVAKW